MSVDVRWIDVRDAVPDTDRIVLIAWGGGEIVDAGRRRVSDGAWFRVVDGRSVDVHYWAELPARPQEFA